MIFSSLAAAFKSDRKFYFLEEIKKKIKNFMVQKIETSAHYMSVNVCQNITRPISIL